MTQARLLEVFFEGYFQCRLATDPDPTIEARGVSGYTMALPSEPELDQIIRLQPEGQAARLREPAEALGIQVGVKVKDVHFDGKPFEGGLKALKDAPVRLEGRTKLVEGPTFQSRNNIVGSDDSMAMVVEPFELAIRSPGGGVIRAVDVLDPSAPAKEVWEFDRPDAYARRFPVSFKMNDAEAMTAISVVDQHGYFWDRRQFLERRIEQWEKKKEEVSGDERAALEANIQAARSRIHQIDFWGVRVFNKLGFKATWRHGINAQRVAEGLGGKADLEGPWTVNYWFGSWDGDLLVGYMRGSLSFPFTPDH